jgi:hypothetical protein
MESTYETLIELCNIKSQLDDSLNKTDNEILQKLVFQQKLNELVQTIMDDTSVIKPPVEIPNPPLPPLKHDEVDHEKLDWIIPPISVRKDNEK